MRRIPLQFLVALVVALSMLLTAAALIYQGYRGMEAAMVETASQSAEQLTRFTQERIRALVEPGQAALRLLRHDPLTQAQDLPTRLNRVPALAETLQTNPLLSAIYIGYDTGEFLLLRHLDHAKNREFFQPPSEASFVLQTISLAETSSRFPWTGEWRFFNDQYQLLETRKKPDYRFDPRTRVWYQRALQAEHTVLTPPYVFFTTQEVGITLAQRASNGRAVMGLDATTHDLSDQMQGLKLTPHTEIALLSADNKVLAYPDLQRVILREEHNTRLAFLDELNIVPLSHLLDHPIPEGQALRYHSDGRVWYGLVSHLTAFNDENLRILIAAPAQELLADVWNILLNQARWALLLLAALILLGIFLGRRIGQPLYQLADQIQSLIHFDFSQPIQVHSRIQEVQQLRDVLQGMAETIKSFESIALTLNREEALDPMLSQVLEYLLQAVKCRQGAIYLVDNERKILQKHTQFGEVLYPSHLPLEQTDLPLKAAHSQAHASLLQDRRKTTLGLLIIDLEGVLEQTERQAVCRFMDDISGSAAVAIETRQLIKSQQALLDAIIKLIADAIDAKSPYTSGHCERVPELAEMILDAALRDQSPAFAAFRLDARERQAFHLAAWLHDCGKIISPEFIIDKATKLETIYNRIHEIRVRFEVLHRDAEISCLQAQLKGQPAALAEQLCRQTQAQLHEEFALIAAANQGGEFLSDEVIQRIQQIGRRTWLRHFDDRLGLSQDEQARLEMLPAAPLPCPEFLLADKAEHIQPWGERIPPVRAEDPRNRWGFDMQLPAHALNTGELYNLCIRRGTLSEEERFRINEHIVHTIIMLESLPLPEHLQRVPAIAGHHHEKMDGSGYPKRLTSEQMSWEEKIMAVADVYEALTASDRPYKPGKTLSESLQIMLKMVQEQHLDAEVFQLFLRSGAYRRYAERFLKPEQLDQPDITALINACQASIQTRPMP
ncbi:HD domain-containing phosphohydrolase [Nitrincola tapanii]|uniref:HD domain-containing protein n=1 Tax=Nitrincola tapanii TaxID=1708751 RepID=A0A5A9W5G6_9GAMM|nr:HD domain-containing phosphohydrolase [Nitrincola tapanii]KAA0875415.1 HD domain-containing protein [Nitrincola tapanii]